MSAVASKASEVLTTLSGEQDDGSARCHDRDGGEGQHAQQLNSPIDLDGEHLLLQRVHTSLLKKKALQTLLYSCCSARPLRLHGPRKRSKISRKVRLILCGLSRRVHGGKREWAIGVCGMFRSALARVHIFC